MIEVNGLKIYPVEVEIYYYKENIFDCGLCHKNELQKGFDTDKNKRFGKLYFHRTGKNKGNKINTGQGGLDICLSLGDYYLSVLIRSAYINDKLECGINKILQKVLAIEQYTKVTNELIKKYNNIENSNVLQKRDNNLYNSFISHSRIKNKKYFYEFDKYKENIHSLNTFIYDKQILEELARENPIYKNFSYKH